MMLTTPVTAEKHLITGELGIPTIPDYMLSNVSRYHLFAHLFDGGFAPQLYANLKVYVRFLPV